MFNSCFFLELEIPSLSPPGCGPAFKYLVEEHEEMETISIGLCGVRSREDEEDIVLTIFSNLNLRSIIIRRVSFIESSGDLFSCLLSTLPDLEKLVLTSWCSLSNQGLLEILKRSRSNLRELDLSYSNITGVGVEEGVNSLPNLEILKLFWCDNLTDGGLKEILRLSGNKLRVLDVSFTSITGQGFKGVVSFPMLEILNLISCRELNDSGLLEILSISDIRLKTVNVSLCWNLSTEVTEYPSVQFKYY